MGTRNGMGQRKAVEEEDEFFFSFHFPSHSRSHIIKRGKKSHNNNGQSEKKNDEENRQQQQQKTNTEVNKKCISYLYAFKIYMLIST